MWQKVMAGRSAHAAFSSSGALGWNTESARTNSPKSITSFFFVSNTSKTRSVNKLLRCCALKSASANSSLWMRPSWRKVQLVRSVNSLDTYWYQYTLRI